ncbi:g8151 [Coccomyxa elongata]
MAAKSGQPGDGSLLAIIGDEDTVTGFLLAGVGNVDLRKKTNFLVVNEKTSVKKIEDSFKEYTNRDDIAIVLINQYIADMIRHQVANYMKPVPAILEIPSKEHPYDPSKDSILRRVKIMFGGD